MKLFKIGLYVRVSTEEQAENPEGSIKNQQERLKEFVKLKSLVQPFGEIQETFVDAGISAKDMNRPALQRLLEKIRTQKIDLVLVTELSRFTRSIKDFSILWEFLEKHQCKFLSIKDNFDTSTAAGEMVMYMMANVAQFERKQTAERISQSFLARAKRGLFNGGSIPLGYEVDSEKPGHLKVIAEEAEIVREIFRVFLREETLAKTAKAMNESHYKLPLVKRAGGGPRAGIFRFDFIHKILCNRSYVGVRTFKTKTGFQESRAMWDAIIDAETFERAQRLLKANRHRKRSHLNQRYPYTLAGICFCKVCGDRMSGKSAHGRNRKVPYYEHAWLTKQQAALSSKVNQCSPHRVPAEKLEPLVWQEVKKVLAVEDVAQKLLEAARRNNERSSGQSGKEKLVRKAQAIDLQIEALAERIARLPKRINEEPFLVQMAKMQESKDAISKEIAEMNPKSTESIVIYEDFARFTNQLKEMIERADREPEIQTAIIRKLVHRVEVMPNGIEIHFFVGDRHIRRKITGSFGEPHLGHGKTSETKMRPTQAAFPLRGGSRPLAKFLKNGGSKRLTSGGGDPTSGALSTFNQYPHDTIRFIAKTKEQIFAICDPLYAAGCSLRDIEAKTGFRKTSIMHALKMSGRVLRSPTGGPKTKGTAASGRRSSGRPYGYDWVDGVLVMDPKEYRVVQKILKLWRDGQSARAIARELNGQGVPAQRSNKWSHGLVISIVERHKKKS